MGVIARGGGGGWNIPAARASVYNTDFNGTENPLSEGGVWVNGLATGLDWQNMQSGGGLAYGAAVSTGYDDCIAHLHPSLGISGGKHYAQATVYYPSGYTPPDTHEIALHVACQISAHSVTTYEYIIGSSPVRWNGPSGDFTVQGWTDSNTLSGKGWTDTPSTNIGFTLADGDVIRWEVDASSGTPTLTLKVNGTTKYVVQDTNAAKLTSGQPGIGAFMRTGGTLSSRGFLDFSAGSL